MTLDSPINPLNLLSPLELDNPFWAFSLRVWAKPALQAQLLTLQRTDDIDINLLLFAIWCGTQAKQLPADMSAITRTATQWQQHIKPLRSVRLALAQNPSAQSLKTLVQKAEVLAEQYEQAALFAHASDLTASMLALPELLAANLNPLLGTQTSNELMKLCLNADL